MALHPEKAEPSSCPISSDGSEKRTDSSSIRAEDSHIQESEYDQGDAPGFNEKPRAPKDDFIESPGQKNKSMALGDAEAQKVQNRTTPGTPSRTSSAPAKPVPASMRRGLFGRFTLVPEVERPYDYSSGTKWVLLLIVALAGSGAPVGSSIIWPALTDIVDDLDTTQTIAILSVALYMLSMSIFPLWWSAFSETMGRRTVYLVSFALFVIFSILSAVSTSIAMLIVMRILGGGAAASVQAVGAGTIADIFEVYERGRAIGLFYLGPLLGPLLAPIIGGALTQCFGWRSSLWFLAIYGAVVWLLIFLCLPETLARRPYQQSPLPPPATEANPIARTESRVSKHANKTSKVFNQYLIDPLMVLKYLRFQPILITVVYAALTFGCLFVLGVSIQLGFSSPPYDYPAVTVGLLYLPPSIAYIITSIFGGRWIDVIMRRAAQKANRIDPVTKKLIYLPEDRMRENVWISASLFPFSLIAYGWTIQYGLPWPVPAVTTFLYGIGAMLVLGATATVLTEFMPNRSSSGVAINNTVRNILSCVGAVVAEPMIRAMGYGWSLTLIGVAAWIGGNACVWALRKYGSSWREEMDKTLQ